MRVFSLLFSLLLVVPSAAQLRGTTVEADGEVTADKAAGSWYIVDHDVGLSPHNAKDLGNNKVQLTVKPDEEAVRLTSVDSYTGGKFEFKVRSASVMPGVITAVYFASGRGRTSDRATGQQDEIDLEWKGNDPTHVQTNVFLSGGEDLQLINLQADSSQSDRLYALEWDEHKVSFSVDGRVVRTKYLQRKLAPMQLHMAVWTTMGGWPGLVQWGGKTEWYANGRNGSPAIATFEILTFPNKS